MKTAAGQKHPKYIYILRIHNIMYICPPEYSSRALFISRFSGQVLKPIFSFFGTGDFCGLVCNGTHGKKQKKKKRAATKKKKQKQKKDFFFSFFRDGCIVYT